MKAFIIFFLLQSLCFVSHAQVPSIKNQQAEMKEQVAQLKKEIAEMEAELKKAELENPEDAAMLRTQLNALKSMLAVFEKPKAAPPNSKVPVATVKPSISPIVPVVLKQPIVAPTATQAKDYFFWYRGKKVNDSTLITRKGMVVQYSKKRLQLIIQPEKKTDTLFMMAAREITKNEERKNALVKSFDARKNGFIYYPYLDKSLAVYDDLLNRYTAAVKNTINFKPLKNSVSFSEWKENAEVLAIHGPNAMLPAPENLPDEDLLTWVLQQLQQARKKIEQLPAVNDFPAPPERELGMCASCDKDMIRRQFKLDSIWTEAYHGKEAAIMQQVLNAAHPYQVMGIEDSIDLVNSTTTELMLKLLKRMQKKDSILMDRYSKNLEYFMVITPVVLGHERQLQLLGYGEEEGGSNIAGGLALKGIKTYRKYLDEQVGLKNHDFVLNMPFHLGIERQMQLLGTGGSGLDSLIDRMLAYNRFALTMEVDFAWERRTEDGELEIKATGNLASREKTFTMLIPDSCGYRMIPYTTDLDNRSYGDVTLKMAVKSGIKMVKDEAGKLKNIPYSGPGEYSINFPDSRIEFCAGSKPDTIYLSGFSGDDAVASQVASAGGLSTIHDQYTIDLLMYAGLVFYTEEGKEPGEDMMKMSGDIMNSVAGSMQQSDPGSVIGKMKMKYEGYMQMDNMRKGLQETISTQKARILFNANNRSTVLTDEYKDTKRKLEDGAELTRGMTHLRIVHEPVK